MTVSNLELYRVFYQVASAGRITDAAQKLHISQPAVSQSLKSLETQLGMTLFNRTSKGVTLTKEGEILFGYVARGYEQFMLGEAQLERMQNLEIGEVRIGASDMTLRFFLLPFLEAFHEKYPDIKVIVTNGPTPETLNSLENGKIDFGIVSTPFETERYIKSVAVREIEDTFICGRRFISYKNRTLDLRELEEMPLISLENDTSSRSYMDAFLQGNHVKIHPEFELATSDMIVQFALRNLGIGIIMKDFALEFLESGKLFELRFNKMIPKRHFCLVRDTRTPLSIAAEHLLGIIMKDVNFQNGV